MAAHRVLSHPCRVINDTFTSLITSLHLICRRVPSPAYSGLLIADPMIRTFLACANAALLGSAGCPARASPPLLAVRRTRNKLKIKLRSEEQGNARISRWPLRYIASSGHVVSGYLASKRWRFTILSVTWFVLVHENQLHFLFVFFFS